VLRSIIRSLNDMKLRTKLFLSFIIVVLVPVLFVGIFLANELRNMALSNASEQTAANIERVKQRTAEVIGVAYDSAYVLANGNRLERAATRHYETIYDVVLAYREFQDFYDISRLYREVAGIRFYIENPTLLNNWEFIQPSEELKKSPWYEEAISYNGLIGWHYIEDERDQRKYLSLVRKVNFPEQYTSGVLIINVDMNMLNSILSQETFETMIVDASNVIVSANRPEWIGRTLRDINFDQYIISQQGGTFEAEVNGIESQIRIEPLIPISSYNSLRVISVFSVDEIVRSADRINRLALTVIFVSIIVAVFLTYAFSNLISNRMLRLSHTIAKVAKGNLNVAVEIDGKDEIGQLSRQFNAMVTNINRLMGEVRESNELRNKLESKQNEIKFKMMASQINPHFLFNTLESIRMKAHLKGQKDIAQVVRLLGKMMRKNLEAGRRRTKLKDEIDMIRCYLDIQKFRYEERLHYEIDIDPIAEETLIPPLIIQPLVENSVIHGLENKENGGTVRVEVKVEGNVVKIEVSDNGAGISNEKLQQILKTLNDSEDDERNRIGLRNVHLRLQLYYGKEHGLHIESVPGAGTCIYFSIPTGGKPLV
jgi:two-component system, sensor histidine kinase YesM